MVSILLNKVNPAALAEPAKALTEATRDAASFSLAADHMIPNAALGLALQACVREGVNAGGLCLEEVLGAFGTAIGWVITSNGKDRASCDRLSVDVANVVNDYVAATYDRRAAEGKA